MQRARWSPGGPPRPRLAAGLALAALAVALTGPALAETKPAATSTAPAGATVAGTAADIEKEKQEKSLVELAFRLELEHPEMVEGKDPNRDTSARLDARLLVRNLAATKRTVLLPALCAHQLDWVLTDAQGQRFLPSFLPPPMPLPPDHPAMSVRLVLEPGQERQSHLLHGISGFHREGQAGGTWYRVPPAGTYRLDVRGPLLGRERAEVILPPVRLVVHPAR